MSFFDDVKYKTLLGSAVKYSVTIFGDEAVYFEGIKKISVYTETKVEFTAFGCVLAVSGENLVIDEFDGSSAVVKGKITGVERN